MQCASCNYIFEDTDSNRKTLNRTGAFVAQNPNASKENVGFHWNSLATMSWGKLAEMYLRAKHAARSGDLSALQQFYQKRLGLPWKEYEEDYHMEIEPGGYEAGDRWEHEGGIGGKGQIYAAPIPAELETIPLRFLTVDCQLDHFFLVVRSWSAQGSSRLVWCERVLSWGDIDDAQKTHGVHNQLVFVDAGYNSYEVYRQCSQRGWTALMGDARKTYIHKTSSGRVERFYSPVKKIFISRGQVCRMHYWSNLNIKDILHRLRRNQDKSKGETWEVPDDAPEEYLKQMDSERRVKKGSQWTWEQIGKRPNHYWDCESMSVAAAVMLKIVGKENIVELTAENENAEEG
jgi:hypothetical protein